MKAAVPEPAAYYSPYNPLTSRLTKSVFTSSFDVAPTATLHFSSYHGTSWEIYSRNTHERRYLLITLMRLCKIPAFNSHASKTTRTMLT
jgi:hypothetical protein